MLNQSAAALCFGAGFAATSSATAAPTMGEVQVSANADTDLLRQGMGKGNTYHPKDGFVGGNKVGTKWLAPKTCYERKRVGPKRYVLVRRAC